MILDRIFSRSQAREQVIYLGDGKGDFCPSLRLDAWDHVLARSGYAFFALMEVTARRQESLTFILKFTFILRLSCLGFHSRDYWRDVLLSNVRCITGILLKMQSFC